MSSSQKLHLSVRNKGLGWGHTGGGATAQEMGLVLQPLVGGACGMSRHDGVDATKLLRGEEAIPYIPQGVKQRHRASTPGWVQILLLNSLWFIAILLKFTNPPLPGLKSRDHNNMMLPRVLKEKISGKHLAVPRKRWERRKGPYAREWVTWTLWASASPPVKWGWQYSTHVRKIL